MRIFNYEGSISRMEYWKRMIIIFLAIIIPTVLAKFLFNQNQTWGFVFLYLALPGMIYLIFLGMSFFKTLNQRIKTVGDSFNKVFFLITGITFLLVLFLALPAVFNFSKSSSLYINFISYSVILLCLLIIMVPIYYGIIKGKESDTVVNL